MVSQVQSMFSKKHILVIDDHPSILEMLKLMLEWEGFNVTLCPDSSQAFLQAEKLQPNLIMLDLMMPKPNGWEVLATLQQNSKTSQIPVILMSAAPSQHINLRSITGNAEHIVILAKPFENDILLNTIQKLLKV